MKHKTKKFIYNIVVILLLITGISWVFSRFIHLGRVEYTDNAQIRQLIVPVNSRVQGFIDKICFDEYRPVRKGRIRRSPYSYGQRPTRIPTL